MVTAAAADQPGEVPAPLAAVSRRILVGLTVATVAAVTTAVTTIGPSDAAAPAAAEPGPSYARIHIADRVVLGRRVYVPVLVDCVGAPPGATLEAGLVEMFQNRAGQEPVISFGGLGLVDCDDPPARLVAALDCDELRPGPAYVDVFYKVAVCTPTCTTLEDSAVEETVRLVRPHRHCRHPHH